MKYLIGIIVLIALWIILSYNRFVRLIAQAKEAWADIEVQLKRRYDLIPNLVNTVKGYAAHESGTLEKVIAARNSAMSAGTPEAKAQAENALAGTLKSLFALSENYPDLKANQNFIALQQELSDTENKIQAARRFYNGTVRDLNIASGSFPGNIIASIFHFEKMNLFELDNEVAREPVSVQF